MLGQSVKYYKHNTGVKGRPCDYDNVNGLTGAPISNDLYEYLDWKDKEQWFGLSGDVFLFEQQESWYLIIDVYTLQVLLRVTSLDYRYGL